MTVLAALAAAPTTQSQVFVGFAIGRSTEAIRLKSEATVNYTSSSASVTDFHQTTSPPIVEVNTPGAAYNQAISATLTPTSALAKDYALAQAAFRYVNGGYGSPDSLRISIDVHGSAEQAFLGTPLKPAALQISVGMTYTLLGEPDGGLFRLTLPGLPSLGDPTHENLLAELSGPGTFIQMHPGAAPQSVTLQGSQNWTYAVSYFLNIPHGVDPDFSYVIDGGTLEATSVVPEPATIGGFAALGLLAWRLLTRPRSPR